MSGQSIKDFAGWEKARAVRVAFLVEPGEYSSSMLDGIFADCYSRWGGRFSLVVPCLRGEIAKEYWAWLELFDPDIVYSYVELTDTSVLEIHERIGPADYIFHQLGNPPRLDLFGFKPRYPFTILSSLSTLFRFARHSPATIGPKIKIVDCWHTEKASRFLSDNLGTYHASAATGIFPNDARSVAGLLTIVSDEHFQDRRYGVPPDLDRVATERIALEEFAGKRATSLSLLSSFYSPRLEVRDHRWGGAFNLVIGETFEDRLMFWNARLLIPTWLDRDLCCMRVTRDQLLDEDFSELVVKIINSRNYVDNGSGGQARLQVRSASHNNEELVDIVDMLSAKKLWSIGGPPEIVSGGHVIPSDDALRHARERAHTLVGHSSNVEWHGFQWTAPVAYPPVVEPEHLKDAPNGQSFVTGLWAMDLTFAHESDRLRIGDHNLWLLAKRWRMASAFETNFNSRSYEPIPISIRRASRRGDLTIFAGVNRTLKSVKVPSISEAMRHAFCTDSSPWLASAGRPPWPLRKAAWMRPSNETPHLSGILGMTDGLANARRLLLHPFMEEIFADLGGAPNLADADIRNTVGALKKRARGRPVFDLKSESEQQALAALIVKAAQSIKAPRMYVSLDELRSRWRKYRENFWASQPPASQGNAIDRQQWDEREQRAIDETLAELRARRMVFQGYPWTCSTCQHRNWTDFQSLRHSIACDVCQSEMALPVGIPWFFRPNEFLIDSLRSHSVLSLIWVLSALHHRSTSSFQYLGPSCFGYSQGKDDPDAEADLLVLLNGKSIMCEVKTAWRSLRTAHVRDFVELAVRLRPDCAILAVMEKMPRSVPEVVAAGSELNALGIEFELLTPDEYRVGDDPFLIGS
jgi:hypothetical protein